MRRSKKPTSSSDEVGVYERWINFPSIVADTETCWPIGKPRTRPLGSSKR